MQLPIKLNGRRGSFIQRLTLLIGMCAALSAEAVDILPISSSTRALGMGNAHFGVVDDGDSIFYNPAGLARHHGIRWRIFSLGVGIGSDIVDNYELLEDLDQGSEFADTLNEFYGDNIFVNGQGSMSLSLPFMSFGVYNHTYASVTLNNPVYPELPARFINDYGYYAGLGVPIAPFLHAGMAFKRIKRSGVDKVYRASSLTSLDPDELKDDFTQHGIGYALDLGGNFVVDAPFFDVVLSGVWQNVGDTKFRAGNGSDIPTEKQSMGLGAAVLVDLPLLSVTPALDVTHLNRSDIQLMRKINFGVEVGLPLVDLRAGFQQGYYTAGAGIGIGPFQIEGATYGVELGDYPGQMEDRRYMVEMSFELGIGSIPGFGRSSSSSSGSPRSGSVWGGKRLKQRR